MLLRSLLLAVCLLVVPARAEQVFRSPSQQATLLELYTSEGCSSCPPADRWFSGLLQHPQLWQRLVPVAFHVDYWNDLGWEDRFSSTAFGARQRAYRRQGRLSGVYTPGVVAAGTEWRSWRHRPDEVPMGQAETGVLEVHDTGERFTARFTSADTALSEPLRLHVAILGFGLRTEVAAGENRGRELRHDFVVLSHRIVDGDGPTWSGRLRTPVSADQAERVALVAWVSPTNRLEPLQAVGGWR